MKKELKEISALKAELASEIAYDLMLREIRRID